MKQLILSLAIIGALVATGAAEAQKAPTKKIYRWVDKDGKVQFSDSLPPEAIDQARTEMSNTGRVVADVDRALTPEEQAAAELAAAEAERLEAEAERVRKSEEAMLASFQTEDDLRRAQDTKVTMLQQTLEAIEAAISSQRSSLTALLLQASENELAGKAVNAAQAQTIVQLHREIGKQQQMLIVKQAELVDADRQLAHLLERFRELKRGDAPGATPAPTPEADAEGTPPADAPAVAG